MKTNLVQFLAALIFTIVGISSCEAKSSKDALPTEKMQKSLDDPSIRIDMHLKCIDICIAHYVPHGFMLYKFIPFLFLIIWGVCLFEVIFVS